jgi:methionine synthase I (cobalamin-dependent)
LQSTLLQLLRSGSMLLMDGAMGSQLQCAGAAQCDCYEQWNLLYPDRIAAIHKTYIEAGAEVLLTNTFQANPAALAKHRCQQDLESICEAGVDLAKYAAGDLALVLASIGPWSGADADLSPMIKAFAGVDGYLVETLTDPMFITQFKRCHASLEGGQQPLLASFTYCHDASGSVRTILGLTPEAVASRAAGAGVDALGVNCGRDIDMDDVIEVIRRYRTVTDLPLFARPNAGTPVMAAGQWVYPRTPDDMAAKLPGLLEAGVSMVGGCCGTTPAHIAALRKVIG